MKITELIDPQLSYKKVKNLEPAAPPLGANSGAYGFAEPDEDPHLYNKNLIYPTRFSDDGYFQYLRAIKPYMGENPLFPRVYSVTVTRDSKKRSIPRYNMEKLYSGKESSEEEIIAMGEALGIDMTDMPYWNRLTSRVSDVLKGYGRTDTEPPEHLTQAQSIIRRVVRSNEKFNYDMHPGNFMVRRTQLGPQLVITDPIADAGHSQVGQLPWNSDSKKHRVRSDRKKPRFE